MTGTDQVRAVSWVRAQGGAITSRFDFVLETDGADSFAMVAAADVSRSLEQSTLVAFEAFAQRIPPSCRERLVVETGLAGSGPEDGRHWLLAMVDGVVLHLAPPELPAGPLPWIGETDDLPAPDLPVVLAPSALHNLVRAAASIGPEEILACRWDVVGGLDVYDVAWSPYPPQDHGRTPAGPAVGTRRLVEVVVSGGGTLAEEDGVVFSLLARSERWLRPLCALYDITLRNLRVDHPRSVAWPERCLILESLVLLDGPKLGPARWEARYSLAEGLGRRSWGRQPRRLSLAAGEVLANVAGALGDSAPACDPDPIEGDTFGMAPPVLTAMTAAALRLEPAP